MEDEQRERILKLAFGCQPALVAYAYTLLSDYAAAEDIVQDALIVVAKKYADFEPGTSMIAWCRTIVRLQAQNYLRKQKNNREVEYRLLLDAIDNAFESQQTAGDLPHIGELQACLQKLPNRARRILGFRYSDENDYTEIARLMGMKLEAVRKSLYRSKQLLRECLDQQIPPQNSVPSP